MMVGDALQLVVTVKTANLKKGEDHCNPFSKQFLHVLFKRLKNRGFSVMLLDE